PATDRFDAFAMSALRPLRRQTSPTLSTGRYCANQYPVSYIVDRETFAEFFDNSDRFMSDNETRFHPIFSAQNMKIRSANCCQGNSDDRFAHARGWSRNLFDADFIRPVKDIRAHRGSSIYLRASTGEDLRVLQKIGAHWGFQIFAAIALSFEVMPRVATSTSKALLTRGGTRCPQ